MNTKQLCDQVKEYIDKHSWFEFDNIYKENDKDVLSFTTRQKGSVIDEEPGTEDIRKGYEIKKALKERFPGVETEVTTCDEWTDLKITLPLTEEK